MFLLLIASLFMNSLSHALPQNNVSMLTKENPFSYNLGVKIISGNSPNNITICCHGYGHNNQIVDDVKSFNAIPGTLIGFNFPDYNITPAVDHKKTSYGTINEILPLLFILRRCVVDLKLPSLNLYGFSAGGGAIINALAVLNQTTYDSSLKTIGITAEIKKDIIKALEKGVIILDCPLKSWQEVRDLHHNSEFSMLCLNNTIKPIESLQLLKGLTVTILVHFQKPDEILGNRDDALFIDRLKKANSGTTTVITGFDGGHNSFHTTLWNEYKKITKR